MEARSERRRLDEADERSRWGRGRGEGELEATWRGDDLEDREPLLEERAVRERDEEGIFSRTVGQCHAWIRHRHAYG